jgi:hypothetical protein
MRKKKKKKKQNIAFGIVTGSIEAVKEPYGPVQCGRCSFKRL